MRRASLLKGEKGRLENHAVTWLREMHSRGMLGEGSPCSRLAEDASGHGVQYLANRCVLNPSFLEWMMNWPPGWTDIRKDMTADFTRWETASSLRVRDMLSWYLSRGCWAEKTGVGEPPMMSDAVEFY